MQEKRDPGLTIPVTDPQYAHLLAQGKLWNLLVGVPARLTLKKSGVIQTSSARLILSPENGVVGTVDTINGVGDGHFIMVGSAASTGIIISSGVGNLVTKNGNPFALVSGQFWLGVMLKEEGTDGEIHEVARSDDTLLRNAYEIFIPFGNEPASGITVFPL